MKRVLAISILLAAALSGFAKTTTIDASDSRVVFVGRTLIDGPAVKYDWSGVSARLKFTGTTLSVTCSSTGIAFYNVWIDKPQTAKADFTFSVTNERKVTLAEKLKKGEHTVIIQKRNEGDKGIATVSSFETDGEFLQGEPLRRRKIEIVGDSYTCGYGTESTGRSEPFRVEEENCNLAYAAILGRYFDADVTWVSHSGLGIVRNYADASRNTNMVKKYLQTFDMQEEPVWDASKSAFTPDIVVIYLGTNDFSVGRQPLIGEWCDNYAKLLGEIRANYGEQVPILCIGSKVNEMMGSYVEEAVRRSGQKNIGWTCIYDAGINDTTDLGADWHPNYSGHRKVASCVIPYVSTLAGWDMPFKVVE